MRWGIAIAASALLLLGCGGREASPRVIATTSTNGTADAGPGDGDVEALVERDEAKAVEALRDGIEAGGDVAALAAAYSLRLGAVGDRVPIRGALVAGASSADALTAALSWRWLATGDFGDPPAFGGPAPDPVVGVFAAAAFARRGADLPKALEEALGLPEGAPAEGDPPADRGAIRDLEVAASPYDGGALGLALAFSAARRERWTERDGGERCFAATGLREELLASLGAPPSAYPGLASVRPARDPMYSALAARLRTPLLGTPLPVLRGTAVRAAGALRADALRALAAVVRRPTAGDLGAAAAALASADVATRVEAARTYLLLAGRAAER